jgi:hypothetical protein
MRTSREMSVPELGARQAVSFSSSRTEVHTGSSSRRRGTIAQSSTIGARGDITITSTTATNRPFLDNTANR